MTAHVTADQVRDRVCGTKIRHRNLGAARAHARALEEESPGAGFAPYPCPFSAGETHYHAGHVPGIESLEAIARVIRGLDPNPPVPHDPPARPSRRNRKKTRR